MPRSKTVTVSGKKIKVTEHRVCELREDILPKIMFGLKGEDLKPEDMVNMDLNDAIQRIEGKLAEIFPDLTEDDIDRAYPSEIEALVEAWIEVNFSGLKRISKPLLSFLKMAMPGLPA